MQLRGNWFVTGGGGYLARAIYRRAREESWDVRFTALVRRDEQQAMLNGRFPEVRVFRGDIAASEVETLAGYMTGHDGLIHAAAVKYVDLAEFASWDTVRVNVDGSRTVAMAAVKAGIPHAIAISTDKAVRPANVYGSTKMVMERLWLEADIFAKATEFRVVRYGNVVSSSGSVIPKLRAQYKATGSIDVTDPSMTRYWMTHGHAVNCILASLDSTRGTITIPNPGAAYLSTILEAAGIPPAHWRIVGLRPGEKMDEMLVSPEECPRTSQRTNGYFEMIAPGKASPVPIESGLCSADAPRLSADDLVSMIADAEGV